MRLEIRRRGVEVTERLREHIAERLRLSLGRCGRHIDLVRVYLRDMNGPRGGGTGKKCHIVVGLPRRGRVVVTGADANISAAITSAASRAGLAVKRHVKRRVARRRRRVAPSAECGRWRRPHTRVPGHFSGFARAKEQFRGKRWKGAGDAAG